MWTGPSFEVLLAERAAGRLLNANFSKPLHNAVCDAKRRSMRLDPVSVWRGFPVACGFVISKAELLEDRRHYFSGTAASFLHHDSLSEPQPFAQLALNGGVVVRLLRRIRTAPKGAGHFLSSSLRVRLWDEEYAGRSASDTRKKVDFRVSGHAPAIHLMRSVGAALSNNVPSSRRRRLESLSGEHHD